MTKKDDKITDLETRLAYQEDLLETLEKRVIEQETELSKFQLLLHHVNEKVKNLQQSDSGIDTGNEVPPHY